MPDGEFWIAMAALALAIFVVTAQARMQDSIARIDRKLNALLRHFDIDAADALGVSDRVKELARDPSKRIEAIKVYRAETGVGLAEAKDAVDAVINAR